MNIAYFVNKYPAVSHSFIRREILALEKKGASITRFALKVDEATIIDATDKKEMKKTQYILKINKIELLGILVSALISSTAGFFRCLGMAVKLGARSERGVLRHIAYFLEAMVLRSWMKKSGVTHVHAHFGTNSTMVAMLASIAGDISYSFTVHGPEEFDKSAAIHLPEKIQNSKFVVAITSYCRSQLFRQVDTSYWQKIHIVHCGLDNTFLQNVSKDEAKDKEGLTQTKDENMFVCVGRLCEQKGQLLLIEAVNDVIKAGYDMRLILAGDGPMRNQIEKKIQQYGLQEHISITGWLDGEGVKTYLKRCKVMVLPSFAEGLPVVIMEALALKRPVITTYIAGIPELIENGKQGWLVPAGCRDKLTDVLVQAIKASPEQCQAMGASGWQKVVKRHDVAQESEKLVQKFAGIL